MSDLEDILNSIDDALHIPDLARDLAILSKILHNRYNCHRKFKYYQAFKQMQTLLKKFTALKIRREIKQQLRVSPEKRERKKFFLSFSAQLYKGLLYMAEIEKICQVAMHRSLEQIKLCHYVQLSMVLISVASKVHTSSIAIQNTIRQSYEQLRGRCSNIPKLPVVKKKKVSIEKAVKTEHLLQSIFKDSNSNVTSDILSDEEVKSHAFPSMDTSANDNEGNNKKMSFLNSIQAIFAASNID